MTSDRGHRPPDIAAIAQNDQLDDEFIARREIKDKTEGSADRALIVDGNDETAVVPHDVHDRDRHFLANEAPFWPVPDRQSCISSLEADR